MKLFFCSVALVVMSAGCRDHQTTNAPVDHANREKIPLQTGLESVLRGAPGATPTEPPGGLGGGPRDEAAYPASSALNVLIDAACRCNATAECRQSTATRYAETLGRCAKGVGGRLLSQCASYETATSCGSGAEGAKGSADACSAPALCEVGP